MPHPTPLFWIAFVAAAAGLALPLLAAFREVPAGSAPDHPAVFASAWVTAFFWWVGAGLLWAGRDGGRASDAARAWWAAGCGFALLHVAIAFHCHHGWSHAAAYEHTAAVGGWGPGLYVNFVFLAVWAADVLWMWWRPAGYGRRPRWIGWVVHGFLTFIVFNATVVFGHGPGRWVSVAAFGWLGYSVWDGRRPHRPAGPNSLSGGRGDG